MTYGELFGCRTFVQELREMKLSDGGLIVRLNAFCKKFAEVLEPYQETYNGLIRDLGENGQLTQGGRNWSEFVREAEKAALVEVEWEMEGFLDLQTLIDAREKLSGLEYEMLEVLGILQQEEGPKEA